MRTRRSPLAFALLVTWAGAAAAGNTDLRTLRTKVYRAFDEPVQGYLRGSSVVPPTLSLASGHATMTVDITANTMTYHITHNVTGETAAHIRGPAGRLENGALRHALPLGTTKDGVWSYSDADETELMAGRIYIDIRSSLYPNGEIRGQIECYQQPVLDKIICLRVVVQNLGPDLYDGTSAAAGAGIATQVRRLLPAAAGAAGGNRMQISVDIDEPTKPGTQPASIGPIVRDFPVTLAPGDSIELDFGDVSIILPTPGLNHVRTTSSAQGVNNDPVAANNTKVDTFDVLSILPALGLAAGLAGAVLIAGAAGRSLGRRRASRATDPPASGGRAAGSPASAVEGPP